MCLGIPGRVAEIRRNADGSTPALLQGVVDFGGVRREVCLSYVADEVREGDYVVVHVGFAISKIDEAEARRTYEILESMSRLDELDAMHEADADALRLHTELATAGVPLPSSTVPSGGA